MPHGQDTLMAMLFSRAISATILTQRPAKEEVE
jgi:hypothetical protein